MHVLSIAHYSLKHPWYLGFIIQVTMHLLHKSMLYCRCFNAIYAGQIAIETTLSSLYRSEVTKKRYAGCMRDIEVNRTACNLLSSSDYTGLTKGWSVEVSLAHLLFHLPLFFITPLIIQSYRHTHEIWPNILRKKKKE